MPQILLPRDHKTPAADRGPSHRYFTLLNSWDEVQRCSV